MTDQSKIRGSQDDDAGEIGSRGVPGAEVPTETEADSAEDAGSGEVLDDDDAQQRDLEGGAG